MGRRVGVIGAAAVLLLGALGGGVAWLRDGDGGGPAHPKHWDARILPLVRFVEEERGLEFAHPVAVEYLSDAGFRKAVGDDAPLSQKERRDQADEDAEARALGLPSGPAGLEGASQRLDSEGILAYYDDDTERIEVRGSELTVERRVTVVHELTHALQDQHFDLTRQGSSGSDDRNAAFEDVVEGDAVGIENAYIATLPRAEQDAYDKESASGSADYGQKTGDVPDWLSAMADAPYSMGEAFVSALDASGGTDAVDKAFERPPYTEAETIDAARYLRDGPRLPATVPEPARPPGDALVDRHDLGALRWLLVLAERLPAADALAAATGWGGDTVVTYRHDGRLCLAAAVTGAAPADTDGLAAALSRWAASMPPVAGASATRSGDVVTVASCDPGPAAVPGPSLPGSEVDAAMDLLTERADALVERLDTEREAKDKAGANGQPGGSGPGETTAPSRGG